MYINWLVAYLVLSHGKMIPMLNADNRITSARLSCVMLLLGWCYIQSNKHNQRHHHNHWLPVEKRIVFKLCLLVYKTRHCLAPSYLCGLLRPDNWGPEHWRRHVGIDSSLLLLQCSGISFQIASGGKRAWRLSRFHLKLTCFGSAMASSQKILF